jgi:twitching motility two-component system response regulator PilG
MQNRRTFRVSVIGLSETEVRVLKSVEWLSTTRLRGYSFSATTQAAPDIYMVSGSDAQALTQWQTARRRVPAPSIVLSAGGNAVLGQRGLKRPIIASKLLSTLDEITAQDLGFMPELIIGEEGTATAEAVTLNAIAVDNVRGVVLVVDDSPTVRKQIEIGLKLAGCAVDTADTAESAAKLLQKNSYDLVFLDVVLPGADGYQLCKSIKRDKAKRNTPVIMLTGKTSALDQIKGALAGCDSYLTKPVQNAVFQQVVRKYIGAARDTGQRQAAAV